MLCSRLRGWGMGGLGYPKLRGATHDMHRHVTRSRCCAAPAQAEGTFPDDVMRKVAKASKALKLSKAKTKDLMRFAADKKKAVEADGPHALELTCVAPVSRGT